MNFVVVVVDRLHAGFLGCYGNAWVATPHFNRLAAQGFLFDQALVDRPDLNDLCQSWWTGTHFLERRRQTSFAPLATRLSESGFSTICLADEPLVVNHPLMSAFDEVIPVGLAAGEAQAIQLAAAVEDTEFARLFAASTGLLERAREPFFLWLHSRGMQGTWDAPYAFREQYADEEDTSPPRFSDAPLRRLASDDDPDELWGICQAYAGQITLLDECLGGLLQSLEVNELASDTVLVLLGARGFPLGRNGRLGDVDQALCSELIQTPWLMRLPDRLGAAARSQALIQPCDLAPTLLELAGIIDGDFRFGGSLLPLVREEALSIREGVCLAGHDGERGFRTPAWYLRSARLGSDGDEAPPELYAKPDDRWEVNDVAGRCPDIVAAMQAAHNSLCQNLSSGEDEALPVLDEALVNVLR